MTCLYAGRVPSLTLLLCVATAMALQGQTFTKLHTFNSNGADGCDPVAPLVQATDGNLYGTTYGCGINGYGTIFKITRGGRLTTLYSFCMEDGCPDGEEPVAGLLQAANGKFYGTTSLGGTNDGGTVFQITAEGKLTTLYSFCSESDCRDGAEPSAGLVQAYGGNLFGTTSTGGNFSSHDCPSGCGTVFKITPGGQLTTLYRFCSQSQCADGALPAERLIQANDGNLYGSTYGGGNPSSKHCPTGCGTVFRITPSGMLTKLHSFDFKDGSHPIAGLIYAVDGNFYGETVGGGMNGYGTLFRMTRRGRVTTVHSFCTKKRCPDSAAPGGLIQANDGNLYGTVPEGGANWRRCAYYGYGCGTIFRTTTRGVYTTLYSFCSQFDCADGDAPLAALVQDTNGEFYGTTSQGGGHGLPCCGTVFRLNVGVGPFVTFVSAAGKIGQTLGILGQGFIGTTSVLLHGTPASFTVVSDTFLKATVPVGATSGSVTVTTPRGSLKSDLPFRVIR